MSERTGTIKDVVETPRWAKMPKFIEDICFTLDLDLELSVDKGWIRETTRFKVTGTEEKLNSFKEHFEAGVEEYNK